MGNLKNQETLQKAERNCVGRMNREDPIEEIEARYLGKEQTLIVPMAYETGKHMKTALTFFDLLCEEKEWRTRGECSSAPLEAQVEFEGVLDEDSPSHQL